MFWAFLVHTHHTQKQLQYRKWVAGLMVLLNAKLIILLAVMTAPKKSKYYETNKSKGICKRKFYGLDLF